MGQVPRAIRMEGMPPMLRAATEAFGSMARLRLVRYFQTHPGTQADAADALGIPKSSMTKNIAALLASGVLTQEPSPHGGRALMHRVNDDRVAALLDAT